MKKLTLALTFGALTAPVMAQADCGEVSISEMDWASAQIITRTAAFLMEQGYGCDVDIIPSATTTAVASLSENGEPDIVTELWENSTGDAFEKLLDSGVITPLTDVITPGAVEGWWVPTSLVEEHPEVATIEGILANPELVDGRFNNCPDGWGCRIVSDNLIEALNMRDVMDVFDHGSGETLGASLASAVENDEPWLGYYWGPTAVLGKYDMTRVDLGEVDTEIHTANQNPDNENPRVSDFPVGTVLTVATSDLAEREPEVVELMSNLSFEVDTLNMLLAWSDENGASSEEAAVYFLTNYSDTWSDWVSDAAREELAAFIE